MSGRTILVVGAHPDDEVLGPGGALARHVDAGDDVHVLIVTEGATTQYDDASLIETKQREARACADRLGATNVHFGELPDMRLDAISHVEVNEVIEAAVGRVSPDIVYTHARTEVNRDHVAVHDSTLVATRPGSGVGRVLAYETPSSTEWTGGSTPRFRPSVYVNIESTLDRKVEAFSAYETETRPYPHPRSEEALRARAKTRGTEAGFEAAEAFELVIERRESLP